VLFQQTIKNLILFQNQVRFLMVSLWRNDAVSVGVDFMPALGKISAISINSLLGGSVKQLVARRVDAQGMPRPEKMGFFFYFVHSEQGVV
jgi:hypothetical protein